jgi:hypothetical protein
VHWWSIFLVVQFVYMTTLYHGQYLVCTCIYKWTAVIKLETSFVIVSTSHYAARPLDKLVLPVQVVNVDRFCWYFHTPANCLQKLCRIYSAYNFHKWFVKAWNIFCRCLRSILVGVSSNWFQEHCRCAT